MTLTVAVRRVGRERRPVAVIDGFHPDPDGLRAAAAATAFGPAGRHYPGLRAPLPPGYFAARAAALNAVLRDVFGLAAGARVLDASFSIVTAAPEELTLEQRLPHVDALDRGRIALVHYLSPDDADGTAFYRHRGTGFETLNAERSATYLAMLDAEVRGAAPAPGYIAGDTGLFERIDLVDGRFNRAVLYASAMLHSGAITPGRALSADPLAGRLTVTGFLAAR